MCSGSLNLDNRLGIKLLNEATMRIAQGVQTARWLERDGTVAMTLDIE